MVCVKILHLLRVELHLHIAKLLRKNVHRLNVVTTDIKHIVGVAGVIAFELR